MALDLQLFYFLNDLAGKSEIFDIITIFFAAYSQYFFIVIFIALLYFSAYSKLKKIYIFTVVTASGILARLGITELVRFFYHRPRPFVTHQVYQLIPENGWSFPSGHSAFFFAIATTIYFYNKKWGVGFFIAAIFMNISRIIAGVHYPSDIIGGMIVGTVIGYSIFYVAKRKVANKIKSNKQ